MKHCLALMLVFGLVSCGGDEQETGEKPAECPDIVYVGQGAEPSSFHSGGQLCEGSDAIEGSTASCLGIDVIYPAYEAGEKFVIIDARPPLDHNLHSIKDSISLPYYDVEKCVDHLPKDVWYVTYCACPHNESQYAASVLEDNGFSKVRVLDEGYIEWRNRGYPTTDNPEGTPVQEEQPDDSGDDTSDENTSDDDASAGEG